MQKRKAIFFDIDGTLWDYKNEIPESAKAAIRALKKNGHLTFLCSGRGRAYIQNPELLELGFDGIISGCGTMIEYHGETIFYKRLDNTLVETTLSVMREHGFRPIMEGRQYIYMDEADFGQDYYGKKLKAELGERLSSIEGTWGDWEVSKFSCATDNADREECFAALSEYYDYKIHNPAVAEVVPKGHHKGTGIAKVCELLNIDIADTVAFGDSANDLEMLCAAGIGVAMGNGSDEAKTAADYVTDSLKDDGIWKACRRLELI
ncbi:MAG: Cof-type HAD-IIB family hydrolase [Eubacteriales bacterium]|nr:Cof-type HAD-IIB family hydrolase [Eubacteriales bacterium]